MCREPKRSGNQSYSRGRRSHHVPDWRAWTLAGRAEPRELLGRAGGSGQPFGVLCFGSSVLERQRVEERNPIRILPKSCPGHLGLGWKGPYRGEITSRVWAQGGAAGVGWSTLCWTPGPWPRHSPQRGSANIWEWVGRKNRPALAISWMFERGEIDLQKMCQGFVAHMTVKMVVPLADAGNAERTARVMCLKHPCQVSPQHCVHLVKAKVMAGPCGKGSSVDWRASPSSLPCIPTPSTWALPLTGTFFLYTAIWLMSSPSLGCRSHLTYPKAFPICRSKMRPPSALLELLSPLPFSILSIFHHTYHLQSDCIVTFYFSPPSLCWI